MIVIHLSSGHLGYITKKGYDCQAASMIHHAAKRLTIPAAPKVFHGNGLEGHAEFTPSRGSGQALSEVQRPHPLLHLPLEGERKAISASHAAFPMPSPCRGEGSKGEGQ